MGGSPVPVFLLIFIISFAFLQFVSSSALSSSMCPNELIFFLNGFQSQCPSSISPNVPLQVDGDFLDRALTSDKQTGYISVLFYASRCPFSCSVRPAFEILSSMYPHIEHLEIEQSSAMPSVLSIYGIHSLPTILMVNHTSRMRYRGPKNLHSLVQFYKRTTGLEPVENYDYQPVSYDNGEESIIHVLNTRSWWEIMRREPYLAFSLLFLCLRVALLIFPNVLSKLKACWVSCVPHLNLELFGETSQIMRNVFHAVDVRRVLVKLRLFKTKRNFHESARNASVWAYLALGESS